MPVPTAPVSPRAIFHEALDRAAPAERAAYLDSACAGDPALRARVEALLAVHDRAGGFLESPALVTTLAEALAEPAEPPGTVIGPYTLVEPIGEGGMGNVYRAEQSAPVTRTVALKVVKAGMDTRQVLARFEAERQTLSRMDHPNIAHVLDAGTTENGRPYFVMELVEGPPITAYCDRERLSIRARLELFVLVCRAVQHAHQKGIIHRDLKPSNVLVATVDGVAVPKVIDFGVAKAIGGEPTEQTLLTVADQVIGTPLYMSPEQADASGVDIDTRADIYALGVLLYELLTGTTPIDQEALRRAALDEVRRIVREQEPPRPSTRLGTLGASLSTVSALRGTEPRRLSRTLQGELDWVVMRCLEKDRARRYDTANGLAADLLRYLDGRPVEAGPPSAWYRFTRFARRNRKALLAMVLAATALAIGVALLVREQGHTHAALEETRSRAAETQEILDYLTAELFGALSPERFQGRNPTVSDLLAALDASIPARFAGRPLIEARFRVALALAYENFGRLDKTSEHLERAVDLRRQHLGPDHPLTLEPQAKLVGISLVGLGPDTPRNEEAERLARHVYETRRRVLGPLHPDTLNSLAALASAYGLKGRLETASTMLARCYAAQCRSVGPEHIDTLMTLSRFAQSVQGLGDLPRAEAMVRHLHEACLRRLGPDHTMTLRAVRILGLILVGEGRYDEGRALLLENIEGQRRIWGILHPRASGQLGDLFPRARARGDAATIRDICELWLREVLAMPADPDPYLRSRRSIRLSGLARDLVTLPAPIPFDEALALRAAEEVAALNDGVSTTLGIVLYRIGDLDRAEAAITASMARHDGGDGFDWCTLALIHAHRGDLDRAREWLRRARAGEDPDDLTFLALRDEAEALIDPTSGAGP